MIKSLVAVGIDKVGSKPLIDQLGQSKFALHMHMRIRWASADKGAFSLETQLLHGFCRRHKVYHVQVRFLVCVNLR